MDFYFYGVASYTSYLILESRYIEAYKYVNEQMKYAEAHNYKQGIALGYRLQGVRDTASARRIFACCREI